MSEIPTVKCRAFQSFSPAQFDRVFIGSTFDNMNIWYLTNKGYPKGKRLYVLTHETEDRMQLIDVYAGVRTLYTQYQCTSNSLVKKLEMGTRYIDDIMDPLFSCFVCDFTGTPEKPIFHFYEKNCRPDNNKILRFQGVEIFVGTKVVEIKLPEFPHKITGQRTTYISKNGTNISWSVDTVDDHSWD